MHVALPPALAPSSPSPSPSLLINSAYFRFQIDAFTSSTKNKQGPTNCRCRVNAIQIILSPTGVTI